MKVTPSDAIDRALVHAPFLRRAAEQRPDIVARIAEGDVAGALALCPAQGDADNVGRALRMERQGLSLAVALADLAGLMPFEAVVERLSDFADSALDRAVAAAIEERTPGEAPRGFAVLGLGKHGSRELNYSSDIDPDPDL